MNQQQTNAAAPPDSPAPLIFVVDDSPEVGEMLEIVFRHAGYPTRVFTDPLQALAALNAAPAKPRVLISDFRMPGINGLELIQRCKQVHPNLRIISASAHIPEEEIAKHAVQPDRILLKPYTTANLLELVKSFLDAPGTDQPARGSAQREQSS